MPLWTERDLLRFEIGDKGGDTVKRLHVPYAKCQFPKVFNSPLNLGTLHAHAEQSN